LIYKPSVRRNAASTRAMFFTRPSFPAMALSNTVARLSVITTESVRSPASLASGELSGKKTRLGLRRGCKEASSTGLFFCVGPDVVSWPPYSFFSALFSVDIINAPF